MCGRALNTQLTHERRKLWAIWTLWCAAGETIGIGLAAAIAITAFVSEPSGLGGKLAALTAVTIGGCIEGLAVGSFQWRVLRGRLPELPWGRWTRVTVGVAALFWVLGSFAPIMLLGGNGAEAGAASTSGPPVWLQAVIGAAGGAVAVIGFGFAQWMVLRDHAERASRWIWINAAGWALAMFWIMGAAGMPTPEMAAYQKILIGCAAGVLAGVSVGVITGYVVVRLEARERPA